MSTFTSLEESNSAWSGSSALERPDAMREELLLIREALDDCGSAVIILGADGATTYLNAAFGTLFGYTPSRKQEASFPEVFADPEVGRRILRTVLEGGRWQGEVDMVAKEGRRFPATLRGNPVLGDAYDVNGALFIFNDISARKQLEAQLVQSQKLKSIGQLAAGIAHEINTPIQYVGDNVRFLQESFAGLLDLIGKYAAFFDKTRQGTADPASLDALAAAAAETDVEYLSAEIPMAITESLEGIGRVTEIVKAMRQFTHPGSGEKKLVDINQAIRSTVTVARNEWRYVAELDLNLAERLPPVPCYPGDFNQVILNLVVNAAQAIAEKLGTSQKPDGGSPAPSDKGRITVSTRLDGADAVIVVADTGKGIPEVIHEQVFDPFFTTKEVGKGTGQGLALSRATIVEKHHGTLDFESEEGTGTSFVIRLPIVEEAQT